MHPDCASDLNQHSFTEKLKMCVDCQCSLPGVCLVILTMIFTVTEEGLQAQ
jgi:hypothetical protein